MLLLPTIFVGFVSGIPIKIEKTTPITFTVGAAETLFTPFGLWHTAHSLTATISVAFD